MNKIKQSILTIVIGLALVVGISFAAETGVWVDPTCAPTGCNTVAPINAGSNSQAKLGFLSVGTSAIPTVSLNVGGAANFNGVSQFNLGIIIPTGAGLGKVLTSNATGAGSWGVPFPPPNYVWAEAIATNETKTKCPVPNFTAYQLETALIVLDGVGVDGSRHQVNFGIDSSVGASWFGLSGNCLSVKRGSNDSDVNDNKKWKAFRVRIWKTVP